MGREAFSPSVSATHKYELAAILMHKGASATRGHYVAHAQI